MPEGGPQSLRPRPKAALFVQASTSPALLVTITSESYVAKSPKSE